MRELVPDVRRQVCRRATSSAIVTARGGAHSRAVAVEPAIEMSEELAALCRRADLAASEARRLLDENDRWRQTILRRFDIMFELDAQFRTTGVPDHLPDTSFSR